MCLTRRSCSFWRPGVFDIIFVWKWLSLKGIEESQLERGQMIKAGALISPRWAFPQVVTSLSDKLYAVLAVPQIFRSTLTNIPQVNVQIMPPPNFRVIRRPVWTNSWSFGTIFGFDQLTAAHYLDHLQGSHAPLWMIQTILRHTTRFSFVHTRSFKHDVCF